NKAQSLVFGVADDRDQRELARLYDLLGPAMERISLQMESGQGIVGIPSGFHDLDRMTSGFKDSDLIIVAGRPAMGKCIKSDSLGTDRTTPPELIRLMGYFIAEGALTGSTPSITNADPDIVADYCTAVTSLFRGTYIRNRGIAYYAARRLQFGPSNPVKAWLK